VWRPFHKYIATVLTAKLAPEIKRIPYLSITGISAEWSTRLGGIFSATLFAVDYQGLLLLRSRGNCAKGRRAISQDELGVNVRARISLGIELNLCSPVQCVCIRTMHAGYPVQG
jgi:hypothetical protein